MADNPDVPGIDDTELFVAELQRHRQAIFAFIYSLLPRRSEAEDVYQKTCESLWRKFRGKRGSFGSFGRRVDDSSYTLMFLVSLHEHVRDVDLEVHGSSGHVPVVRVHLGKALGAGALQVKRIDGTYEDARRQALEPIANALDKGAGHWDPIPDAVLLIGLEGRDDAPEVRGSKVALSEVPVQRGENLDARDLARDQSIGCSSHRADSLRAWFVQVALRDISRIEVDHERSRMSETISEESTGIRRILRICASRSGSAFLRCDSA
jgi:hypothetical protein